MSKLRAAIRGLTRHAQHYLTRFVGRISRLGQPEPLIIPPPSSSIQDPGLVDTDTFDVFMKCSSIDQYRRYVTEHSQLLQDRASFEADLVPAADRFLIAGYCAICKCAQTFIVDFLYAPASGDGTKIPNWRERLICRQCKLPNRVRAMLDFLEHTLRLNPNDTIYVTEQTTPLYHHLRRRFPNTIGSEFLDDGTPFGKSNWLRIRNEDLTNLSLADSSVNLIWTSDVLEHVPNYARAIGECFRILKPGGTLVISVPFILDSAETLVRARMGAEGAVEHVLPPEYHADPVSARGTLCYYHFGWDLLDTLKSAGFRDSALYFYWSCRRGYLGGLQFLISATKGD
jgi:SAM-dependent methyltransferase